MPNKMVHAASVQADGNLSIERGLVPSVDHIVPPPSAEATFHWRVFPAGGSYLGRIYSDGSRLDGPGPLLARNGWSFIVLDEDENLIAAAYGVPPDWVDDIPGTEAWALMQAALFAIPGCQYFVDCQPCVDAVHKGPVACRSDKNPLAEFTA